MTENETLKSIPRNRPRFSNLLGYVGLCAILFLSACENEKKTAVARDGYLHNTQSHIEGTPPPNTKNLFGKSLRSDEERLDRVERALQSLRNDFDSVKPSIKRLMVIEGDMQSLIRELEKINNEPVMAKRPRPAPQSQQAKKQPAAQPAPRPKKQAAKAPKKTFQTKTAPPVQDGKADVYDLRVGEHPGKTRIVLDVNTKTNFQVDIDNGENIMIVELPNASWSAAQSKSFGRSPHIGSYNVEQSGNGSLLIFQLKKSAKVVYKDDLKSLTGSGRRIVIDVGGG